MPWTHIQSFCLHIFNVREFCPKLNLHKTHGFRTRPTPSFTRLLSISVSALAGASNPHPHPYPTTTSCSPAPFLVFFIGLKGCFAQKKFQDLLLLQLLHLLANTIWNIIRTSRLPYEVNHSPFQKSKLNLDNPRVWPVRPAEKPVWDLLWKIYLTSPGRVGQGLPLPSRLLHSCVKH